MPRRKSSKAAAKRKEELQAAAEVSSPKSDPGVALRQSLIEFQPDAGSGTNSTDAPGTPPPTLNDGLSSGSASPESIVSFVKEEEASGIVDLGFGEEGSRKAAPKKKVGRKTKMKPPSPMKRERTEEYEKPPSPMKKEKAEKEDDASCSEGKREYASCLNKKSDDVSFFKKDRPVAGDPCLEASSAEKAGDDTPSLEKEVVVEASSLEVGDDVSYLEKDLKSQKVCGTLDDYFGCSPREADRKGRGHVRRSKSAATVPRRRKPDLEPFALDKHFAIQRRSSRRDEKMIKEITEREIERRVVNNIEEGMKMVDFELKGRGVVATRRFERDEFMVEYAGNLVTGVEAKRLNAKYAEDPEVGSYMFWIVHRGRKLCVDATDESGRFGRLINHSRADGNLRPKVMEYNGKPRLLFFTTRQIFPGEELLYDYGDRDKHTLQEFPWLKS